MTAASTLCAAPGARDSTIVTAAARRAGNSDNARPASGGQPDGHDTML
jgi:hypothetical protein